jgi:hypothetical protein
MNDPHPGRSDFKLTWLHLSDLHFGAGGPHATAERADVLGALVDDIRRLPGEVPPVDQIIVSGDVAFSGGVGEYEQAEAFLRTLSDGLGLGTDSVLVVPGNHDVDRTVAADDDDVRRWLDELRLRGRPVDEAIAGDRDRLRLSVRLRRYLTFAQSFGQSVTTGDVGLGYWTTMIDARDDLRVRISGANTALLSQDDDHGRLQVGLSQLRTLGSGSDDHDVLLLVTHHPLDWLRDRRSVESWVHRFADVHLYGHVHEGDPARISRGEGGEIVRVVAGAVHEYDGRERHGTENYGYSVGALFRTPDGRLGLRVWPRMWNPRNADFRTDVRSVPDGGTFVDHAIPHRGGTVRRDSDDRDDDTDRLLWRASARSARRLGARRTAYPLDLSIAELHDRGVYVPATFAGYTGDRAGINAGDLAAQAVAGQSILILGEPGSGKSVAAYALLKAMQALDAPALVLRVSELPEALDDVPGRTDLALALQRSLAGELRPILIIDGLDETLAEFDSSADLLVLLRRLRDTCTLVVTCRRREFEDNLARSYGGDLFDAIVMMTEWSLERQFADFVDRLVAARFLDDGGIMATVRGSGTLARMVSRPLFARMLTFLGQTAAGSVSDVSTLYAEYIDKLSVAADTALVGVGCALPCSGKQVWSRAAWAIFSKALLNEERFSAEAVHQLVATDLGAHPRCVARALAQICDEWRVAGRVWGRFVHYSFFEYLVACHLLDEVSSAVQGGSSEKLVATLALDLTPEIRHFLVDELRLSGPPGLGPALEAAFRLNSNSAKNSPRVRTVGNIIAYLLSRVVPDAQTPLRRLATDEEDMFLQQSLLWGLCHVGDGQALNHFVTRSRASAQWRAWNRGYLMYYYGDLDRRDDPPYVDADRRRPWGRTRERSIALLRNDSYRLKVAAARRYLDLHTLYEYAIWRGETLDAADSAVAEASLQDLWDSSGLDGTLLRELQAMHAAACRNE